MNDNLKNADFTKGVLASLKGTYERLEKQGYPVKELADISDIPEDRRLLPSSFGEFTPGEISDYIVAFSRLYAAASWSLAIAHAELTSYKTRLENAEAKAYVLSDAANVTTRKYERDVSDEVLTLREKVMDVEIRVEMLKTLAETYKRSSEAASRHITILQVEASL